MLVSGSPDLPGSLEELLPPSLSRQIDRLDVLSRKMFAGKLAGERRSKRRGRSVEFEDHRDYVAGDDLRHIDWGVLARLDKLFIKVFQEEEDLAFHLVVDISPSMNAGKPNKLAYALRMAMALGYIGLVNRNRVSVRLVGAAKERVLTPVRGRPATARLAKFLLDGGREGAADRATGQQIATSARRLAGSAGGRGVVCLLSDFLLPEGYREPLRYLGARRDFDVFCVQLLSPGEMDPEKVRAGDGSPVLIGDLRLTDVETGRDAEVTATRQLLDTYRASVRSYIDTLNAYCTARSMRHTLVTTDRPVDLVILDQLRRRGMLA